MKTAIMKPGILVSLKTTLRGGVTYSRENYDQAKDDQGADVAHWETTRVIEDPKEHERAVKVRSKARSTIAAWCIPTSFGLLCPLKNEAELNEAIRQSRTMVDQFNQECRYSNVGVYVLKGRIAETDEEATRAIADEVQGLLGDMKAGIVAVDPDAIRKAANKAKAVGAMLDDAQRGKVEGAIKVARQAARQIVKRVEKGGEKAAKVAAELNVTTKSIESARFSFLDLDASSESEPTIEQARQEYQRVRKEVKDREAFETAFTSICPEPSKATPRELIAAVKKASGEAMPTVNVQRMAELDLN
jgi:hypothetical protein